MAFCCSSSLPQSVQWRSTWKGAGIEFPGHQPKLEWEDDHWHCLKPDATQFFWRHRCRALEYQVQVHSQLCLFLVSLQVIWCMHLLPESKLMSTTGDLCSLKLLLDVKRVLGTHCFLQGALCYQVLKQFWPLTAIATCWEKSTKLTCCLQTKRSGYTSFCNDKVL